MKRLLLIVVSLLVSVAMFAQTAAKGEIQCLDHNARIERGTRAASDWGTFTNFTATDMNGNSHNIQNYLDQGKYVVIDFFCAWCSPCWRVHQSGILEALYETYGQGGTGEFVVLLVESETSNTAAQITGTHVANTYAGASQGDFTNGGTNPIPMIDATSNLAGKVSLYSGSVPSIYVFCPSGYVADIYGCFYNAQGTAFLSASAGATNIYNYAIGNCPDETSLPMVDINAPDRVVLGASTRITSTVVSTSNVVSYQWSFDDGSPALASTNNVNVTWNTLGTKTVNVTVANEYGIATATKNVDVYDCSTTLIDEFPFAEDFENGEGCWNFVSMNTSNNGAFGVLEYDDGMHGAVFNSYNSASNYNQYMISPELDHIGTLALSFKYKKLSDSGSEQFVVKYSTTDNQPTHFTAIGSNVTVTNTSWLTYTCEIPANAKYFMINYNANYQYYLVVDDLRLTENIPTYTINATPDDAEHGTVTGGGSYPMLSEVTLTATPADGYVFEKWSDDDATNPRTIIVNENVTLTASFVETATATTHTITLNVDASCTDMGSVAGAGTFVDGASVQVLAIANTGYHFTEWNDNVTDNPRTVVLGADTVLTAFFAINQYEIAVVSADANQGSVAGANTYNYNAVAEISATPAEHYHFMFWNDGNTDNPRNVTVTDDATYTAYFALDQYTVTVTSDNASQGTASGSGQYMYNTNAIVYAAANPGYVFSEWQDHNTDNPRTVLVDSDKELTASFIAAKHVTVVSGNPTMGRVSGEGYYAPGGTAHITATAFQHYHFVQWNDENTDASRDIVVTDDTTFTATFAPDVYTITVVSANETMGTVSEGGQFEYLAEVEISATPNPGYLFVKWNDNDTNSTRTITVTGNKTYRATFAVDPDYNAVDENMVNSIAVYPNPTSGIVNIEAEGLTNVVVFDVTGRMMKSVANETTIDISDLEAGVYFFSIETENGSAMRKLVKE